jgi:hypothetical protein
VSVLFLLQTYRNLPQIARLVRTIKRSSPHASVIISHNPEEFRIGDEVFADLGDVHVRYTQKMARGDDSLLREYLGCLGWALERQLPFDWVVNMTSQCYPARPLGEFEQMLSANSYDGYMGWYDAFTPSPNNPWGPRESAIRYNYQYRWRLTTRELKPRLRKAISIPRRLFNNIQPFVKVETSYGFQVGLRGKPPFGEQMRLYGGSFFKTLSRRAAHYLYDYGVRNPQVLEYFRNTLLPEESYPQTVLLNSGLGFSNNNLYYVKWDGGKLGRPVDLRMGDFDAIVAQQAFFARKFSAAIDAQVIDRLDERIFGRSAAREEQIHEQPARPNLHDQAHHLSGQRTHP